MHGAGMRPFLPERQPGAGTGGPDGRRSAFTVNRIRHSFATGLRRTGSDVADASRSF